MALFERNSDTLELNIDGEIFTVLKREIPFREGVELETEIDGRLFRVSDRQLGEREALRLLEIEVRNRSSRSTGSAV